MPAECGPFVGAFGFKVGERISLFGEIVAESVDVLAVAVELADTEPVELRFGGEYTGKAVNDDGISLVLIECVMIEYK